MVGWICSEILFIIFKWAIAKTWTRTLDLDPEKPGPQKNLDPEKHGINMALKNLPDLRELFLIKIMRNVICCSKVHLFRL